MAGTQSISGLASGLDTANIIDQLIQLQRYPIERWQAEKAEITNKITAWQAINTLLLSFKITAYDLSREATFNVKKTQVSDSTVFTASASSSAATGSYDLRVLQLASTHQFISRGFPDRSTTGIGTGTLTIEVGKGNLTEDIPLPWLNGETGVSSGSIKITDRDGNVATIDLSSAVTLQDVVDAINNEDTINVTATIDGNRLRLTYTGSGTGLFTVEDVGESRTAQDLGIATSVASDEIVGSSIHYITSDTGLSAINDGRGVPTPPSTALRSFLGAGSTSATLSSTKGLSAGDVIKISDGTNTDYVVIQSVDHLTNTITWDGATYNLDHSYAVENTTITRIDLKIVDSTGEYYVDLSNATTIGDVIDALNSAENESGTLTGVTASLSSDGRSLILQRSTSDTSFAVQPINNRSLAEYLGFDSSTTVEGGKLIYGKKLVADLGSVLIGSLRGTQGTGIASGSITLQDRAGNSATIKVAPRITATLTSGASSGATSAQVSDVSGFFVGGRVRFCDGANYEWHTITAIDPSTNTITWDNPLQNSYSAGALAITGIESLSDLITAINNADQISGVTLNLSAQVNSEGNGILIEDESGGTGNLVISDVDSTTAQDLGIAVNSTVSSYNGQNVQRQYIDLATSLASLNGGEGVEYGIFRITDSQGQSMDITVDGYVSTIGDLIELINYTAVREGVGVEARINDTGDGILIVDTAGGTEELSVQDLNNGKTAQDLNISGTSASGQINGSFEFTINVTDSTTLEDIEDLIEDTTGERVNVSIISTGGGTNPYRLVITSAYSGSVGRLTIREDFSSGSLSFTQLTKAQDAAVLLGSEGSSLLMTSSSNTVTQLIPGVTINLLNTSDEAVNLTIENDYDDIVATVTRFVDNFNELMEKIDEYARYDPETEEAGILQGDVHLMNLKQELYNIIVSRVEGLPSDMCLLMQAGISISSDGLLSLDENELRTALQEDLEAVKALFTYTHNVALSTNGGVAQASSTATGWDPNDAINGDTSSQTYGAGVNGWRNASAVDQWFEVDFSQSVALSKVVVYTLDSPTQPANLYGLKGYTLQYWDDTSGSWVDEDTITSNTSGKITHLFSTPIYTSKIRLNNLTSNGSFYPIVEVEAYEKRGIGSRLDAALAYITDASDGTIERITESLQTLSEDLDDRIADYEDRLEAKRAQLERQFIRMEKAIQEMQSMSAWLGAQLASLSTTSLMSTGR